MARPFILTVRSQRAHALLHYFEVVQNRYDILPHGQALGRIFVDLHARIPAPAEEQKSPNARPSNSQVRWPWQVACATYPHVAWIGEAGTGKTTLLQKTAVNTAANSSNALARQTQTLEAVRLPIFVPLPQLAAVWPKAPGEGTERMLAALIRVLRDSLLIDPAGVWRERALTAIAQASLAQLELMLDAFDDVAQPDQLDGFFQSLAYLKPARIHLACRPDAPWANLPLLHLQPCYLQPLDASSARTLYHRIRALNRETGPAFPAMSPTGAALKDLLQHPGFLSLLATAKLPSDFAWPSRSELLATLLRSAFATPRRAAQWQACLEQLAYQCLQPAQIRHGLDHATLLQWLGADLVLRERTQPTPAPEDLADELCRSRLVSERGGYWQFNHRLLRDYLAARFLARFLSADAAGAHHRLLRDCLNDPDREEVVVFLVAQLSQPAEFLTELLTLALDRAEVLDRSGRRRCLVWRALAQLPAETQRAVGPLMERLALSILAWWADDPLLCVQFAHARAVLKQLPILYPACGDALRAHLDQWAHDPAAYRWRCVRAARHFLDLADPFPERAVGQHEFILAEIVARQTPRGLPALIGGLEHPFSAVRQWAAQWLSELHDPLPPNALDRLLHAARLEPAGWIRLHAVPPLLRAGSPWTIAAQDLLEQLIAAPNPAVRKATAGLLSRLHPYPDEVDIDAVSLLVQLAREDEDEEVGNAAIESLQWLAYFRHPTALDALVDLSRDPERAPLRSQALFNLMLFHEEIVHPGTLPALLALAPTLPANERPSLIVILNHLARHGCALPAEAVDFLLEVLANEPISNTSVMADAASALAHQPDAVVHRAIDDLMDRAPLPDCLARLLIDAARRSIPLLPDHVDRLIAWSQSANAQHRAWAATALGCLPDSVARARAEELLTDADSSVRLAAAETLLTQSPASEKACGVLHELVKRWPDDDALRAIRALKEAPFALPRRLLRDVLRLVSSQPRAAFEALPLLVRQGQPALPLEEILPALLRLAAANDFLTARSAAGVLGKLGPLLPESAVRDLLSRPEHADRVAYDLPVHPRSVALAFRFAATVPMTNRSNVFAEKTANLLRALPVPAQILNLEEAAPPPSPGGADSP